MPIDNMQDITLKSRQVNEVLGKPPKWLIRWGSLILFVIVITLLMLSSFITYPETIIADAIITNGNTSQPIYVPNTGAAAKITALENQFVKEKDLLLITKTPGGKYDSILANSPGQLKWMHLLRPEDNLQQGEKIFTIIADSEESTIQVLLKPGQAIKVEQGMKVTISLNDYPQDEYGALSGEVYSNPQKNKTGDYCLIRLTKPWPASLKKGNRQEQELQGVASIIIKEQPVIKYIFSKK